MSDGSVQLGQVGRREVLLEQRVVDGDRSAALHAKKLRQQSAVVVFEPGTKVFKTVVFQPLLDVRRFPVVDVFPVVLVMPFSDFVSSWNPQL